MSNAIKKQVMTLDDADASLSNTFFKTNKDKLVGLLLNEISFLDMCFYKTNVKATISLAQLNHSSLLNQCPSHFLVR